MSGLRLIFPALSAGVKRLSEKRRNIMIAKEKLVNIIEHAMIAEYRRDAEKEAMLMNALVSLDEQPPHTRVFIHE